RGGKQEDSGDFQSCRQDCTQVAPLSPYLPLHFQKDFNNSLKNELILHSKKIKLFTKNNYYKKTQKK
ncbi:MAG: hypothetical protein LBM59_07100, partial [Ruminococcus sp.]|nr:hypothetical protein [Ruminococcus sp.]